MPEQPATMCAAFDQARALERQERDERTRAEFDRVDRIGAALQARAPRRTSQSG